MFQFMLEGGYAMWVILLFGLLCLALAVRFAVKPAERTLNMLRPLSLATLFATLSGLAAGLGATTKHVAEDPTFSQDPGRYVMIGIGESLANAILGFTLLFLAWLVVAVGMRRQI